MAGNLLLSINIPHTALSCNNVPHRKSQKEISMYVPTKHQACQSVDNDCVLSYPRQPTTTSLLMANEMEVQINHGMTYGCHGYKLQYPPGENRQSSVDAVKRISGYQPCNEGKLFPFPAGRVPQTGRNMYQVMEKKQLHDNQVLKINSRYHIKIMTDQVKYIIFRT